LNQLIVDFEKEIKYIAAPFTGFSEKRMAIAPVG